MEEDFIVKKILERKDGVKYLIIPKLSKMISGDYVMISKIKREDIKK
jgi:hypothetical protein